MNVLRCIINNAGNFHRGDRVQIVDAIHDKLHLIGKTGTVAITSRTSSIEKDICRDHESTGICDKTCKKKCIVIILDETEEYEATCYVVLKKISDKQEI